MPTHLDRIDFHAQAKTSRAVHVCSLTIDCRPDWICTHPVYPEGCTNCRNDLRSIYTHNSQIAPKGARLAVVGSQNDLFLTAGYGMLVSGQFDENMILLQKFLDPLPNTKYYVANGDEHILTKEKNLDTTNTDSVVEWCSTPSTCGNDTHYLYEFLTRMQNDDPAWQSLSSLGHDLLTCDTKCDGRTCGLDTCGGVCGTCPASKTCDLDLGACVGEPPTNLGETAVLETTHQATDLFVSKVTLGTHAKMLQKLSFYVEAPDSSLRLGIYDATGANGGPGNLLTETPLFTAVEGWNTRPVPALVSLPPGDYWLAHQAISSTLKARRTAGAGTYLATANSGAMPATWPNATTYPGHFSVYATVAP